MLGGISSSIVAWPKINVKKIINNLFTGSMKACGGEEERPVDNTPYAECDSCCPEDNTPYAECDSCCPEDNTPYAECDSCCTYADAVKVYFGPEEAPGQALLNELNAAQTSIHIAIDYFTEDSIRDALKTIAANEIEVKIIFDYCSGSGVDYEELRQALGDDNVRVKKDMANRFVIIDGNKIITGSMNWTSSDVNENKTDLLILQSTEVAAEYEAEFQDIWNAGIIGCP